MTSSMQKVCELVCEKEGHNITCDTLRCSKCGMSLGEIRKELPVSSTVENAADYPRRYL